MLMEVVIDNVQAVVALRYPLERVPEPAEIAEAVLFLLRADSVTGQIIFVDGGQNLLGNGV